MVPNIERKQAVGQESSALDIARDIGQLKRDVLEAKRALARIEGGLGLIRDAAYKLGGYEKKQSGGYGPVN